MSIWRPVVDVALSFSAQLQPGTDLGLKTQEKVKKALQDFSSMMEAVRSANPDPFDKLATATEP